jgi:WhiB family redox-sensing transcriptional regulator
VLLSKETGMTTNYRNFSTGHRVALSLAGTMSRRSAVGHLATDIGMNARRDSWWNNTWIAMAKCRDMDPSLFFPSDAAGERAARRICAVCPVKIPCLEYSLDNRVVDGVWGGRSEQERRFLLHKR